MVSGVGPMKTETALLHPFREIGVLGEEPVAGMNGDRVVTSAALSTAGMLR